jgi:hypothetical protein
MRSYSRDRGVAIEGMEFDNLWLLARCAVDGGHRRQAEAHRLADTTSIAEADLARDPRPAENELRYRWRRPTMP